MISSTLGSLPADASVLIVDDEPGVRVALRRALTRRGLRVVTAESAEEALALLERLSPAALPQVVLSDHLMPSMDGVAFLTEVFKRWPTLQRVLLTGYADLSALERAVNEAHILRFLNKPWEDVALISTLRLALEQWQTQAENQRLLCALAEHNQRLEAAVAERTRELQAAQTQWERTFNAIADPVMLIDSEYRVLRGNYALRRQLRVPDAPAEVMGQRCHQVRAASRFPLPRSSAGPCLGCPVPRTAPDAHGERMPAEAELTGEGRALTVRAYPSEEHTVCVYRDVTPERAALRKLQVADRLAAIGQLAGGVAHELNNPLGGILASAQLLLRDLPEDAGEQREFLSEIESAGRRCKSIVESLLRFSRATPEGREERPGPVQLNRLVQTALPLVAHQYSLRGVHLCCQLDPALPQVLGVEAQLQQVLMSLLANAFDANRAHEGPRQRRILLTTSGAGAWALLSVRDEGPGFSDEQLARLFTPFVSGKPQGQGTGLGLSVSYGIISDHGGALEAFNRAEGGAELRVTLPAQVPADATG